jgi:hypothetical protein
MSVSSLQHDFPIFAVREEFQDATHRIDFLFLRYSQCSE